MIKQAVEAVTGAPREKISIREACRVFNVKFATFVRQINAFKTSGATNFEYKANYYVKKVFTGEEEPVVDYIKTIKKMNYGLSKKNRFGN